MALFREWAVLATTLLMFTVFWKLVEVYQFVTDTKDTAAVTR